MDSLVYDADGYASDGASSNLAATRKAHATLHNVPSQTASEIEDDDSGHVLPCIALGLGFSSPGFLGSGLLSVPLGAGSGAAT